MAPAVDDPLTWTEWGQMDKELKDLISQDASPAFRKTPDIQTVVSTRNAWFPKYKTVADRALAAAGGSVACKEIHIPRRDGGAQRALLYQPSDHSASSTSLPLLVLIHGGGFCYGCPEMEGATCVQAVKAYGCVAVSLSYRLAPEHKFPAATDDCWDALLWVRADDSPVPDPEACILLTVSQITKNLSTLGADASKGFVVGGTSAGGNITAVLAHMARDTGMQPPLTGLYLNVPLLLAPEAVPAELESLYQSREQNALSPVLNKAFMDMYTEAYAADAQSYIWSPFNWPGSASHRSHEGMPRTYFQICGLDVLRDEGLLYERVLRKEYGTETRVDVYPGLPHMFVPNYPTHSLSKKYPKDALAGIGWLLRRSDD